MALVAGFDQHWTCKLGVTHTTGDVTAWTEQVTGTRDLTVPSGQSSPRFGDVTLDSNNVMTFDGTDGGATLQIDDGNGQREPTSGNVSISYLLVRLPSTGTDIQKYILDAGNALNREHIRFNEDADNIVVGSATDNINASISTDTWVVVTALWSEGGTSKIFIDGTQVSSDTNITPDAGDGLTVGARQDLFGEGQFDIAEVVEYLDITEHSQSEIDQNVSHLQTEWGLGSETTPPTPGGSGNFNAETNIDALGFDISWTKATDDTSAQADLRYYVYGSLSSNVGTVANAEANGTLLNSGGTLDINSLSLDATQIPSFTSGDVVYYNVVVEDEAGNKAAYNEDNETTWALGGKITEGGSAENDAQVAIWEITTLDELNTTDLGTPEEVVNTDATGWWTGSSYDATKTYFLSVLHSRDDVDSTATSATSTTLTDTSQSLTTDSEAGKMIETTGGTGSGQMRKIISNTADTYTVNVAWDTTPDGTTTYKVLDVFGAKTKILPVTG